MNRFTLHRLCFLFATQAYLLTHLPLIKDLGVSGAYTGWPYIYSGVVEGERGGTALPHWLSRQMSVTPLVEATNERGIATWER